MRFVSERILVSLREPWQQAVDFCFPANCPLCGTTNAESFRMADQCSSAFCFTCHTEIAPAITNSCNRCGAETGPFSKSDGGCVHCRKKSLAFDSVVCLGMYRGKLKQAMLGAKWSFSSVNMESLADLLWEHQGDRLRELRFDRIIPMPQHWQQRMLRHFNPAWVIAELLSRRLGICCDPHILRRARRTRPQKRVSVNQRFANQKNAFCLRDAEWIRGRRILIVDDVLTTGATCSEAARLLKSHGASACHASVIGRVLDHSA